MGIRYPIPPNVVIPPTSTPNLPLVSTGVGNQVRFGKPIPVQNQGPSGNATSIQGIPVTPTTPTSNQILLFNGTEWVPNVVNELQGIPLSSATPATNEVLQYNGSQWSAVGLTAPSIAASFSSTVNGPISVSTTDTQLTTVSVSGYLVYLVIATGTAYGSVANTGDIFIAVGGLMVGINSIGSFSAGGYACLATSFPYVASSTGTVTFQAYGHVIGSGTINYGNISLSVLGVNPTVAVH